MKNNQPGNQEKKEIPFNQPSKSESLSQICPSQESIMNQAFQMIFRHSATMQQLHREFLKKKEVSAQQMQKVLKQSEALKEQLHKNQIQLKKQQGEISEKDASTKNLQDQLSAMKLQHSRVLEQKDKEIDQISENFNKLLEIKTIQKQMLETQKQIASFLSVILLQFQKIENLDDQITIAQKSIIELMKQKYVNTMENLKDQIQE